MIIRRACTLFALAVLCLVPGLALAAAEPVKTFAVLPFEVNGPNTYAHLRQGIQSMLVTRLSWTDKVSPVDRDVVTKSVTKNPGSKEEAQALLTRIGGDYLIWGSVTVLGEQASLDVQVLDKAGQVWPKTAQSKVSELIPALEGVSREINAQVFRRVDAQAAQAAKGGAQPRPAMNPEFIVNDESRADSGINPQISFDGRANNGRWTSQSLYFASAGGIIGDADNDGVNEIFIMEQNKVRAYHWQPSGLIPAGEFSIPNPARGQVLKINLLDVNRDGLKEVIVSTYAEATPVSFMLNYKDGAFSVFAERIPMFLNVLRTPPYFTETLLGQNGGRGGKPFDSNIVFEVDRVGGQFTPGKRINLPDHTFLYNFGYLPLSEDQYLLIWSDSYDHLRVWDQSASSQLAATDETYVGSPIMIDYVETMPGLSKTRGSMEDSYYIPLRILSVDFDKDRKHELLVSRNISAAAQFFSRYRTFPQGEIQSLQWDGIGLPLLWKTRTIKGSIADYGVTDVDGDSKPDLWVLVNSHPGMAGLSEIRTSLLLYPLDFDSLPKSK